MSGLLRIKVICRALRLPFLTASILPFMLGTFGAGRGFHAGGFLLGLAAVAATHLGANLINDYADSRSGADWQDRRSYGFFGGSKLIQEGVLAERFYLRAAVFCFLAATAASVGLSLVLKTPLPFFLYLIVFFLGAAYSCPPVALSYRRLGEAAVFLLYGPVPVMGGYYIQSGIFPDLQSFILSLPAAFLTTAILFANEVPDYPEDSKSAKFNWVSWSGPGNSYLVYAALQAAAFFSIAVNIRLGYIGKYAVFSFLLIPSAVRAMLILKKSRGSKEKLLGSSRLTIMVQGAAMAIMILGVFL